MTESDIKVSFTPPTLYDLYEKQKLVEAKMAIYKAYTDEDEMSQSMAMKDVLGWSEEKIKENFLSLVEDKQKVAMAEYFADQITAENPPVDYKSPIRLKSDLEKDEKALTSIDNADAKSEDASGGEGESGSEGSSEGDAGGEESSGTESSGEEGGGEEAAEAPPPTFGLG